MTHFVYASESVNDSDSFDFDSKLSEYSTYAKSLYRKKMSEEDEKSLSDKAIEIYKALKKKYIKAENIKFQYLDHKDFPILARHSENNSENKRLVNFAIGIHKLFKIFDDDLIRKIIKKSPLEIVTILREFEMFFQFINADPENYGHGVFREKENKDTDIIFATNDALTRIFKSIIYAELLEKFKQVHKVSRIVSKLSEENSDINSIVESLKRSTIDDSRIALYFKENK